jgi:hypothetical protein
MHAMLPLFGAWGNFYVIVGSAAAALTGLQFVVIVLGAQANALNGAALRAFGTPTVVHFCAALLVAAILSAPWGTVTSAAICLAACGLAGSAYLVTALKHARRQEGYVPVFEDWLWHFVIPAAAYIALLIAALTMRLHTPSALFGVAASTISLLFIGIHNSWDAVTYIAMDHQQEIANAQQSARASGSDKKATLAGGNDSTSAT